MLLRFNGSRESIFKPQFVMFSTIDFENGFDSVILFSNDFMISRDHIITLQVRTLT